MTSHKNNDSTKDQETIEIDNTLQVPQRDIDMPVPGVRIAIVKAEDCMFPAYESQPVSPGIPSLCYLCNSIVNIVFGPRASIRLRTMRYICVHNHKRLNTFDSPSTIAGQLFNENEGKIIVDQCDVLRDIFDDTIGNCV